LAYPLVRDNRVNGTTNLIMGYCARLPFSQLEPFIASLRHTTVACDLCLLIEDASAETVDRLRAIGVTVERAGPSAQQSMTALSSRFFSYLDYLIRRGNRYENVMLTDPATSIFQADPFAAPLPADIVYAGEGRRIGETTVVRDAVVQAMARRSRTTSATAQSRIPPPHSARCPACCAI
jgi:hypothetical protein